MAFYIIPQRYQGRRGTYLELYGRNEILLAGEICFESHDADGLEYAPWKWKVGDGSTAWNDLEYESTGSGSSAAEDISYVPSTAAGLISTNVQDAIDELAATSGTTDIAATIHAATGKTTPVDADELGIVDSAASNVLKKLTWANLKATLKTYFDTLYTTAAAVAAAYQPLDTDLTSLAGLTLAQGDILYRDASGLTKLSAGTSGHVLKTLGAGANPAWGTVPSGSGGAMTLLGTATVAGAAATTLTMSSLDLSAWKAFYVVLSIKNASGLSAPNISLYYNGDTTAANYARQSVSISNASVAATRGADAIVDSLAVSEHITAHFTITNDLTGKPRANYWGNRDTTTQLTMRLVNTYWSSATNITSITISSSTASCLAIGTTFSVFGIN